MDFLLLIAAAAAVVWTIWFVLRGSLVAGCVATIIACGCFGYSFWHAEGGPFPLSVDRALIFLLAITYGTHRLLGSADPKPLSRAEWVLIAFLMVLAISTFSHDWHDHNNQPLAHLVLYWLMPATVYWVARQSPLNERAMRWTVGSLAIFGIYLTLTALAEATRQWWAVFPSYIASPTTEFFGRARGPFLHPAEMGIYLTVSLVAALMFWPRSGRGGRMLLLVFAALAVTGIYATLTRCAWIGGALGLAVLVGFSVPRQWRILLLSVGVIAGVATTITTWDSVWNLKRDVKLDAAASADSAELRPILAHVAWEMFYDRPLVGCGYGQYDRERLPYLADRSSSFPLDKVLPYVQHNAFLALLAETGLVGMGLFLLLLLLWIRSAWRVWTNEFAPPAVRQMGLLFLTLVGAYFPNAMFQDTNIIDGVNLLLFFSAGIVSGLAADCKQSISESESISGRRIEPIQATQIPLVARA